MIEKKVRIPNMLGLHARPASLFAKTAEKFESEITVEKDGIEVDGKSILGLMMLVAEKGSEILIRADGPDEKEAIDALVKLVEDGFGEE
jgi:phosphocarrier protein